MRTLHVVSLPHTTMTERNLTCAYTAKVWKFVNMMQMQGCRVVLYGPDEVDLCEPDEHVVITRQKDRRAWGFGDGFDTVNTPFLWDSNQDYWRIPNKRAIKELNKRVEPQDYLCLIAGWTQQPIAAAVAGQDYKRGPITVEWGVGYEGIFCDFCAFESYAWMHHVYGLQKIVNGRAFDTVIPNFFDPDDFTPFLPKEEYLLYIGRLVSRKGPHIAHEIAKRIDIPLVVAGPGAVEWGDDFVRYPEGFLQGNVRYIGEVGLAERAELMARAHAVLVPTLYVEPFGGVAVEAMLSGTPVIASDWGSFTEIVTPEVGARFRTLREALEGLQRSLQLPRRVIVQSAVDRFSLASVGPHFSHWFDSLDTLWGEGWYALNGHQRTQHDRGSEPTLARRLLSRGRSGELVS